MRPDFHKANGRRYTDFVIHFARIVEHRKGRVEQEGTEETEVQPDDLRFLCSLLFKNSCDRDK